MNPLQQQVIKKMNENQETDAHKYSWRTIPKSLRIFWMDYFREKKRS